MKQKKQHEANNKNIIIHLGIKAGIFLIFFLGVFVEPGYILIYFLMALILANLIYGFINRKRSIIINIILFGLAWTLFIPIFGYLTTLLGTLLSFIHAIIPIVKHYRSKE